MELTREFLQQLIDECKLQASETIGYAEERTLLDLAQAANNLDAHIVRSSIECVPIPESTTD